MTSAQIRQNFLDFFAEKQHKIVPSAPVVPLDDPTLLFTNAGMNQFKNIFLGLETPASPRVADTQKCIRVSGKHNDLEDVGFDTYHHTFFEMLGNWSFGDYYKKEAIEFAWELLTGVWKLPKNKLYATVFREDDEAEDLWKQVTDIPSGHVLRFDEKDNFWEMGDTGPCGPCSEIHIDLGEGYCDRQNQPDHTCGVNGGCARFIELWNLVFIQFNREADRSLKPLKNKHVDTGMGFERIVAVLQSKHSNYDTDIFKPLIDEVARISGVPYPGPDNGVAHRVLADHIRALSFAIADGAIPSNEGRGYVLRRILRRAARFGRALGVEEPLVYKLVPVLAEIMGGAFPELHEKADYIALVIKSEEESFNTTLDRGLEIFDTLVGTLKQQHKNQIPGEEAFKLYDTYGFPLDLTELMAREKNLTVDTKGFAASMEAQRQRARAAGKFTLDRGYQPESWPALTTGPESRFIGYTDFETETQLRRIHREGEQILFTLAETPFYAESGGQVGDQGIVEGDGFLIEVEDTQKIGSHIIHIGKLREGGLLENPKIVARIDTAKRLAAARNHTATHLLHQALRDTLGKHVSQAGSLVAPNRLRFDVTHFAKMELGAIEEVEGRVNENIRNDLPIETFTTSFVEARKLGAMAIFEEKYGEVVRVVKIGDYSLELCGGTHLHHTGETGFFHILGESSAAAGIRRLEAITGQGAEDIVRAERRIEEELKALLQCQRDDLPARVAELLEGRKNLERELAALRQQLARHEIAAIATRAQPLDGFRYVAARVTVADASELRMLSDTLRDMLRSGVGVLAAEINGKISFACTVTEDLVSGKGLRAGEIVKRVAAITGGSGGGQPHLALAGGKDPAKLDMALSSVPKILRELIA